MHYEVVRFTISNTCASRVAGSSSSLGLTYKKPYVDAADNIADAFVLTASSFSSLLLDEEERSMTGILDQFALDILAIILFLEFGENVFIKVSLSYKYRVKVILL